MRNNFYWVIIIVVVIIGILACILTQHIGTTETIGNTEPITQVNTNNTNASNENNTSENDNINSNTNAVNENTTDVVAPEVIPENTDTVPITNNQVYESNTDLGSTEKKQEAINIVKAMWGDDSTVTYRCDSITSDGKYIVAVVSLETASVKNYFKVDLTTKTAEVDY